MKKIVSGNNRYISGVLSPHLNSGDKVRLRTVDEIDELSDKRVIYFQNFKSYKDWMADIRVNDQWFRPDEVYVVKDILRDENGHDQIVTECGKHCAAWILIKVSSSKASSSKYRTTDEGFQTCDDNWLPKNRLI